MSQVYEGRADLNIQPFLDNLAKLEAEVTRSVGSIAALFARLDQATTAGASAAAKQLNTAAAQVAAAGNKAAQGAQQSAQAQQSANSAAAAAQRQRLTQLRQALRDEERALKDAAAREEATLKQQGRAYAEGVAADWAKRVDAVKAGLATEQRVLNEAQSKMARAARVEQLALNGAGASPKGIQAARDAYRQATEAAQLSATKEASLQRQLTTAMKVERTAQMQAAKLAYKEEQAALEAVVQSQNLAGKGGLRSYFQALIVDLKQTERSINDIFRAGSQLSSLGKQLTFLAGSLIAVGAGLTKNASDFDFWVRRTTGAAQAAGSATTDALGRSIATVDEFQQRTFDLQRSLGAMTPEEVAQSWYLYQAAAGSAITTIDELQASQNALNAILKAAIITDTDNETAVRGVTQAMAEFGLAQEDAGHAVAVILNLTQTSQAEFTDVLESFKMIGPQAAALGMDIEEVSAIMARLSDSGLRGSRAGTGLQQVLTSLLDPSQKASDTLDQVFQASVKTGESWRDLLFAGGQFVGMLNKVDAAGNVTKKGFLQLFAEATKGMSEVQRESYLAAVFPQNAFRNLIPLVKEYTDRLNGSADAVASGKDNLDVMAQKFRDVALQGSLFNAQWETVADSLKVRWGQATAGVREGLLRVGLALGQVVLPWMEKLDQLIQKFIAWADTHPALSKGLLTIAAAVTALVAVLGPLLVAVGFSFQAFAGLKLAASIAKNSIGLLRAGIVSLSNVVPGLVARLTGLSLPVTLGFAAIAAALVLLYLAWKNNWGGMADTLAGVLEVFSSAFAAIGDLVGGLGDVIEGALTGDSERVAAGVREMAYSILEVFVVLPEQLAVYGYNIAVSLANGLMEGVGYVAQAAYSLAETVAQYFRSYSPPKFGPLRGIQVWGKNLIDTLTQGMQSADLDAISEVAGRIADTLKLQVEQNQIDPSAFLSTAGRGFNLVDDMLKIVREGGKVAAGFFAPLKASLGEWYDLVVKINLAYQDMYAAERSLQLEQDKLDVLKQQRAELQKQNDERQSAFDQYLKGSDTGSYASNPDAVVDPTSDAGKASIARMKSSLSTEDFQNWINWQKRLWDEKAKAEDAGLKAQEDGQQKIVDAKQLELDTAKAQYDLYVKAYDYAKKMYDLAEEQKRLIEEQKEKGAKEGLGAIYGTPEQLEAYRQEISKLLGEDIDILDAQALKEKYGDDIEGAVKEAGQIKEREQKRLADLEELNKKKQAEFEVALINATSDEERRTIKEQKDAWDAAYREARAHLEERINNASRILDVEKEIKKTQDEAAKAAKEAAGGGGAGVGGGAGMPGGFDPDKLPKLPFNGGAGAGGPDPVAPLRKSRLEAIAIFESLARAIDFLKDPTVSTQEKFHLFGEAIQEYFGYKTWWDALAPEESRAAFLRWTDGLKETWGTFADGLTTSWNTFWFWTIMPAWTNFSTGLSDGWNGFWTDLDTRWTTFSSGVVEGWNTFWTDLDTRWKTFSSGVVQDWNTFWTDLGRRWDDFRTDISTKWTTFWSGLQQEWDSFAGGVKSAWAGIKSAWDNFWGPVGSQLDSLVATLGNLFAPILSFLNRLSSISFPSMPSWLSGGPPTDGSHRAGLASVPFDGYVAELHRGERVLTAREASVYRAMQNAMAAADSASSRTLPAVTVQEASAPVTNNHTTDNRSVVVNTGPINARNPDEGVAFVSKIAFLAG